MFAINGAEQLLAIADYGPTFGSAALSISRACSSQEWGTALSKSSAHPMILIERHGTVLSQLLSCPTHTISLRWTI